MRLLRLKARIVSVSYLSSCLVDFRFAEGRYFRFHTKGFFPGIFDVQEPSQGICRTHHKHSGLLRIMVFSDSIEIIWHPSDFDSCAQILDFKI